MLKVLIKRLRRLLMRITLSKEQYAKAIGVTVGENTMIYGYDHWSSEPYLISVGSNCGLASGCKIFTHGGGRAVRSQHPDFDIFGRVQIGDWCYIGTNALIMPGVTIGDNVLVGAGSIVTKSVPNNSVVAGNPARVICSLEEYYNKNKQYDIHTKGLSANEKKRIILSVGEEFLIKK